MSESPFFRVQSGEPERTIRIPMIKNLDGPAVFNDPGETRVVDYKVTTQLFVDNTTGKAIQKVVEIESDWPIPEDEIKALLDKELEGVFSV
jgi:hypothetical protein